jgi:hypothetical protein
MRKSQGYVYNCYETKPRHIPTCKPKPACCGHVGVTIFAPSGFIQRLFIGPNPSQSITNEGVRVVVGPKHVAFIIGLEESQSVYFPCITVVGCLLGLQYDRQREERDLSFKNEIEFLFNDSSSYDLQEKPKRGCRHHYSQEDALKGHSPATWREVSRLAMACLWC